MPANADEIWNRACDRSFDPVRAGDSAFAAVIGFHGQVMNGGLSHGLEADVAQAERAAAGFTFLGAKDLGQLIDDARNVGAAVAHDAGVDPIDKQEARLDELERRYNELTPSDSRLVEIFSTYLAEHPDQFEPLRSIISLPDDHRGHFGTSPD